MNYAWALPALGVGLALVATQIRVSRAALSNLSLIHIAVDELKPKYLCGPGTVPPSAMEGSSRVIRDLRFAVLRFSLREESATKPDHGQEA
jgi:hypothetical protein